VISTKWPARVDLAFAQRRQDPRRQGGRSDRGSRCGEPEYVFRARPGASRPRGARQFPQQRRQQGQRRKRRLLKILLDGRRRAPGPARIRRIRAVASVDGCVFMDLCPEPVTVSCNRTKCTASIGTISCRCSIIPLITPKGRETSDGWTLYIRPAHAPLTHIALPKPGLPHDLVQVD